MSDFVCVDSYFVHKLPDNVPLDVGGEPLRAHTEFRS